MRRRSCAAATAALLTATLSGLVGCSGSPDAVPTDGDPAGTITVFAAASLAGVFTELAEEFEAAHPGVIVELSLAGSSDLATQIAEGAPADVFASADERTMSTLVDAGLIDASAPVEFATNVLEIAVPPQNPARIAGLSDLAGSDARVVVCAPQVPCGAATAAIEAASGVDIRPVSEESSVTDVLGKVVSGEADAGIVYVTDVRAAGDAVRGIPIPEAHEAVNTYPLAPVAATGNPVTAHAFIAFVTGDEGRRVLEDAGFGRP